MKNKRLLFIVSFALIFTVAVFAMGAFVVNEDISDKVDDSATENVEQASINDSLTSEDDLEIMLNDNTSDNTSDGGSDNDSDGDSDNDSDDTQKQNSDKKPTADIEKPTAESTQEGTGSADDTADKEDDDRIELPFVPAQ